MPRFPVTFRRKSTAAEDHQNGLMPEPSFRVLERPDSANVKAVDAASKMSKGSSNTSKSNMPDLAMEDNLFAGLDSSRGSGSSNNTKTGSENSSRHSNASMTPSAEFMPPQQEDWRNSASRRLLPPADNFIAPVPPIPPTAHKSGGFLKHAGRTFSFGKQKSASASEQPAESVPPVPDLKAPATPGARSRATTTSTVTATTPSQRSDADYKFDLSGEFTNGIIPKFDKRSSVATIKERDAAHGRPNQPYPHQADHGSPIQPPPQAWNNQHANEELFDEDLIHSPPVDPDQIDPPETAEIPPTIPENESPERRVSVDDSEDTTLLSDLTAASRFLNEGVDEVIRPPPNVGMNGSYGKNTRYGARQNGAEMFDKQHERPRVAPPRMPARVNGSKVMTPQEFEKYRRDKVKEERLGYRSDSDREDEDINYDDDEDDEAETSKKLQRQRRKQEAHLSVYRQQMMKVTGETGNPNAKPAAAAPAPAPTSLPVSLSLGTLSAPPNPAITAVSATAQPSDGSDDEEIPLAILAAHGFPNKNRPPTRLSTMGSQTNLKAAAQRPLSISGPASVTGDAAAAPAAAGNRLPPFARKLPQDPYLGAGLINQPLESLLLLEVVRLPNQDPLPTGGLIGVIANEERARALRRGSPAIDHAKNGIPHLNMNQGFDPINGIPSQMMYPPPPQGPVMTAGDQAQLNQSMQQFMQMQMQFMQMMASQNPNAAQGTMPPHPMGHASKGSLGQLSDMSRNSFLGGDLSRNSFLGGDLPRNSMLGGEAPRSSVIAPPAMSSGIGSGLNLDVPPAAPQIRTMSMVQPSSAPWIQPPPTVNAPPVHLQGGGYAPSIAPSERSNVGLPGRYRPVSSIGLDKMGRTATMGAPAQPIRTSLPADAMVLPVSKDDDDDDDDEGWAAMKSKRDQKKNMWRSRKSIGADIRALIN